VIGPIGFQGFLINLSLPKRKASLLSCSKETSASEGHKEQLSSRKVSQLLANRCSCIFTLATSRTHSWMLEQVCHIEEEVDSLQSEKFPPDLLDTSGCTVCISKLANLLAVLTKCCTFSHKSLSSPVKRFHARPWAGWLTLANNCPDPVQISIEQSFCWANCPLTSPRYYRPS